MKTKQINIKYIFIAFVLLAISLSSAWWDSSYSYRQKYQINQTTGSVISSYPVYISVDTASLIAAGKMRADCNDVRFVNSTNNLQSFQITGACNSSATGFWVNVTDLNTSKHEIIMYYGNPNAVNASSSDVFSDYTVVYHFDEGTGTTIHDYAGGGTVADTASIVASSYAWVDNGKYGKSINITAVGSTQYIQINDSTDLNGSSGYTIDVWMRSSDQTASYFTLWKDWDDVNKEAILDSYRPTSTYVQYSSSGILSCSGSQYSTRTGDWVRLSATYSPTSGYKIYYNGVLCNSTSTTTFIAYNAPIKMGWAGGAIGEIDEVRYARKILSIFTDPSVSKLGGEEILNTVSIIAPSNNSYLNYSNITLQFQTNSNSSACDIYINNVLNTTFSNVINDVIYNYTQNYIDGSYNWYVNCTNAPRTSSVWTFTVDTTPPSVSITSPANGSSLSFVQPIIINGTSSDAISGLNYTRVIVTNSSGGVYLNQTTTNSTWSFTFWLPNINSNDSLTITATAYDNVNNSNTTISIFSYDNRLTDYDSYLNVDDKYISNSNCYINYTFNGITYYYPKVYSNGSFIDSRCRTAFAGVSIMPSNAGPYAVLLDNKIYVYNHDGVTHDGTITLNNNYILYNFNQSRVLTLYYFYTVYNGRYYPTITISNGTHSISQGVDSGNAYIYFNSNGTICNNNNSSCIYGYNRPLQMNISVYYWTCDTDYGGCNPSFTLFDDWILNNSIVGWNNTQIKVTNTLSTEQSIFSKFTMWRYTVYNITPAFWNNATIRFPMFAKDTIPMFINKVVSSSSYYPANIFSVNGEVLKPRWIFYLNDYVGNAQTGLYKAWDPNNYQVKLFLNNGSIIQDDVSELCYFIPAYSPSNLSLIYSVTGYLTPCSSDTYAINPLQVPLYVNCYSNSTHYIMNITSNFDLHYELYYTHGGINDGEVSFQKNYYKTLDKATNSNVSLYINSRLACQFTDQTKILGLPGLTVSDTVINKIVITPIFISTLALSVLNPFVSVIPVILNDTFSIISVEMMAAILLLIFAVSIIMNHNAVRDMKYGLFMLIMMISFIAFYIQQTPTVPKQSGLTSAIDSLVSSIDSFRSSGGHLEDMLATSLIFLFNLMSFLLQLPLLFVQTIEYSLIAVLPIAANVISFFAVMLETAIYIWIIIKVYEIISNKFQRI